MTLPILTTLSLHDFSIDIGLKDKLSVVFREISEVSAGEFKYSENETPDAVNFEIDSTTSYLLEHLIPKVEDIFTSFDNTSQSHIRNKKNTELIYKLKSSNSDFRKTDWDEFKSYIA